jgi:23S rRNA 5-hydroxycytidine C2501 synthase
MDDPRNRCGWIPDQGPEIENKAFQYNGFRVVKKSRSIVRWNFLAQIARFARLIGLHLLTQGAQFVLQGVELLLLVKDRAIEFVDLVLGIGELDFEVVDARFHVRAPGMAKSRQYPPSACLCASGEREVPGSVYNRVPVLSALTSSFPMPRPLELLAPAKNADFGIEAIRHGADAVYIGGPSFGARASAGNTLADIERLCAYAHRFHAHVLVALNTILRDEEIETARRLAWQMYEAGADALIVQDLGLLEVDLPPLQLHASTQTDIRSTAKARFLQDIGFSQLVLARELALPQIRAIAAAAPAVTLEFFVHGALCVSYSGQCYLSHAHTGRSANRGECSQACRLPYDLEDTDGSRLAAGKHLLSLKDNDQSANLRALADAGIGSFKIEGRLKDLSYVKNITAHYRTLLDTLLAESPADYCHASAGRSTYTFTPQPEKTFNRGATDYFVHGREASIAAFETPNFAGAPLGQVSCLGDGWFELACDEALHNGDGLSFFDSDQELLGLRINTAREITGMARRHWRCTPLALPAELLIGTPVYRNRDQEFERLLEKRSAERRIGVRLLLADCDDGFRLTVEDETGISATVHLACARAAAQQAERAEIALREGLSKLGTTDFRADSVELAVTPTPFLPASTLNGLRRDAIEALLAARATARRRPSRVPAVEPPALYPEQELSYLGNVFNQHARDFYSHHGVSLIADAYETNQEKGLVSLMITKHCLRYSFNLCPKEVKGIRPDPMTLVRGKERLTLRFDCKRCEMHVVGKLGRQRVTL